MHSPDPSYILDVATQVSGVVRAENFALIIFLCDYFRRKYPPGAQRVEIVFMETVYCSKLGFSDELEWFV